MASTPQETVERALAAARCDDCIVLADESATANLRWAGNTLTTNGVARSRQLTVIAISRGAAGASAGVVSRAGVRDDQVEDVVRAAEQAASESSPAEDAAPLLGTGQAGAFDMKGASGPGWDDPVTGTQIGVFGRFADELGGAFAAAQSTGRKLYGFAEHTVTSSFLGTSAGLRLRHDQPTGKVDMNAKSADLSPVRVGRAGHPGLHRRGRGRDGRRAGPAAGLAEADAGPAGRPVRDAAAADRRG